MALRQSAPAPTDSERHRRRLISDRDRINRQMESLEINQKRIANLIDPAKECLRDALRARDRRLVSVVNHFHGGNLERAEKGRFIQALLDVPSVRDMPESRMLESYEVTLRVTKEELDLLKRRHEELSQEIAQLP